MKDQYFGDVDDFRKYALLRSLVIPEQLRLGFCWMLTEPDGRTDGNFLTYLSQPKSYRRYDPELFDWLHQSIVVDADRHVNRFSESGLLGSATFHSSIVTDPNRERTAYFADCAKRFIGCDLVFFDPDNALETASISRGRKNARKYLFWHELTPFSKAGSSVMIYQHFICEERAG